MKELKCGIEDVDCLINTSADDLNTTWAKVANNDMPCSALLCTIMPVVDDKVLLASLSQMTEAGRSVPTLQGWCLNDGAGAVQTFVDLPDGFYMDQEKYNQFWSRVRGNGFEDERDKYFNVEDYSSTISSNEAFMAASDVLTTEQFMCGVTNQLKHREGEPLFVYQYEIEYPGGAEGLADHSCELHDIFGPVTASPTAKQMQTWWTNFAIYHDPNGEGEKLWPQVDFDEPKILRISEFLSTPDDWPKRDKCEYWSTIAGGKWLSTCHDLWWQPKYPLPSSLTNVFLN